MRTRDVETLVASSDPLLEPVIRAAGAPAEAEIERILVNVVQPLIERIASRYLEPAGALQRHDVEDVASAVHVRVIDKLRRVASSGEPIEHFEKYAATLTYNVINDHLRERRPERARLRLRLRYVLTNDPRFALWPDAGNTACGLREWHGSHASNLAIAHVTPAMRDRNRPAEALAAIFAAAGHAVTFDRLLELTAELWQIVEPVLQATETSVSTAPSPGVRAESKQFLEAVWREIKELPPQQRKALLLNLREETTVNVISLLVVTGVAQFDDVAAALEMSAEELAAIWYDLPLDDRRIAEMLQLTRQQVINLRKSARARLHRRTSR